MCGQISFLCWQSHCFVKSHSPTGSLTACVKSQLFACNLTVGCGISFVCWQSHCMCQISFSCWQSHCCQISFVCLQSSCKCQISLYACNLTVCVKFHLQSHCLLSNLIYMLAVSLYMSNDIYMLAILLYMSNLICMLVISLLSNLICMLAISVYL